MEISNIRNRSIIGVIGSGAEPHAHLSVPLGKRLAEKGFHLINGGGGGVMGAVAQAYTGVKERSGNVIAVLPAAGPCDAPDKRAAYKAPPGYPNPFSDLTVRTHLHLSGAQGQEIASRNHIIVLTADVVIALPGGAGTRSEIGLSLEYGKPLILLSPNGEWEEFRNRAAWAADVEETVAHIEKILAPGERRARGF